MSNIDKYGRIDPPLAAGEIETLVGFLEWQRSTLEWKTRGLSKSDLGQTVGQSSMTLGGILKHMSFVEDHWFSHFFFNRARSKMWLFVDWTATPDWEWTSAALDSPDTLLSIWKASVDASRVALAEALAIGTLDRVSARSWDNGESPTLRWILIHMIAEYARHNGHADLIREVVDGQVGE